jgi:hypothetical protein
MCGVSVFVGIEGVGAPDVDGIGERPRSGALAHCLEGCTEVGGGKGNIGDVRVVLLGLGVSEIMIRNMGRE